MGPYAGKRVAADGVLYPRYTAVEELVNGAAPAPVAHANGHQQFAGGKHKRTHEQAAAPVPTAVAAVAAQPVPAVPTSGSSAALQAAAAAAAAAGMDPEAVAILQRKAAKRAKREARDRTAGVAPVAQPLQAAPQVATPVPAPTPAAAQVQVQQPQYHQAAPVATAAPIQQPARPAEGNAAEAARIRAALGYTAAAAPAAAAPSAVAALGPKSFGFGFSVAQLVEAETEAKIARIMMVDSSKDGFVPRKVWVSGMPHEFSEQQVREYWEYCGPVQEVDLFTFKDTNRFNGTVNVTFVTQEGYEAALAVNGEDLEGRKLRVEKCKLPSGKRPPRAAAQQEQAAPSPSPAAHTYVAAPASIPVPSPSPAPAPPAPSAGAQDEHVAYVGNIAFESTEDQVMAFFKPFGATLLRMHKDKKTGKPKGFAHVYFPDAGSLSRALGVDGSTLHDRALKVMPGQPPKKNLK